MGADQTADVSENARGQRANDTREPLYIRFAPWFFGLMFALYGVSFLLGTGFLVHISQRWLSLTIGVVMLVVARGLWRREQSAIAIAVVLQSFGLVVAFVTVRLSWIVPSIALIGAMYAVPRRVWQ